MQSAIRLFCAATARPRHHPIPRWQNLLLLSSNPRSTRNLEEFLNRLKDLHRKSKKTTKMRGTKEIQTDHRSTDGDLIYAASIPLALLYPSRSFFFFFTIGNRIPFCLHIYIYFYAFEVFHLFLFPFANILKYWYWSFDRYVYIV